MARTALWPERWPSIALQECIDKVDAAPDEQKADVRFALPCTDCEMSSSCLTAKRKELGPLLYDREILTKPRTSESSLFPRDTFEPMLNRRQALVPFWHKPFGDEERYAVVQAWDIAWSEKIGGDYLVCMTAYLDRTLGLRHMLEIERWQRKTFQEQMTLIEAKWATFQADLVVIEGDAAQKVWKQQINHTTAVPVLTHESGDKQSFAAGVPSLLILLENRRWEFPYERGTYRWEETNTFLSEMEAFGWNDGKLEGVGEHDDTVMCWWHLNWGLDRMLHAEQPVRSRRGVQKGAYI